MSPAAPYPIPFTPPLSEADHLLLEDATAKLRSTLRLPAANPLVARWLFSNHTSAFHSDANLLPPSVFSDSLVLQISSDITSFSPSAFNPFASPFTPPPKPATRSVHLNLLLVPAAHVDDLVLGYSAAMGDPFDRELYPFVQTGRFLPNRLMRGRFAFCPKDKHMVCVVNDFSPDVMGIIGLDWFQYNRRQRYFFTVPNHQYDFHDLPTRVLALLQNTEFKVAGVDQEWFARPPAQGDDSDFPKPHIPQGASLDGLSAFLGDGQPGTSQQDPQPDAPPLPDPSIWTEDFLDALGGLSADPQSPSTVPPQPSQQPPPLIPSTAPSTLSASITGSLVMSNDYRATPGSPRSSAISTTPVRRRFTSDHNPGFDLTTMFHSLVDLERSLEGKYFAPRMSRDIMNPNTGEIVSRTTGEMRASLQVAKTKDAKMLRDLTAQTYYAMTMAVTNDTRLAFPSRPALTWQQTNQGTESGHFRGIAKAACKPGKSCLVRKRPRLEGAVEIPVASAAPTCINCMQKVTQETMVPVLDEDAIREAKKEAKRRKNRLSAARSNHRKKEKLEAQKKELAQLRERVVALREQKKQLDAMNSTLREQVDRGVSHKTTAQT